MIIRSLFNRYKKFALVTLPRFYKKIPKLVLYSAAAFGFFCAGILFTFFAVAPTDDQVSPEFYKSQVDKHLDLIDAYEELSDLYYYQGQNMNVITDLNMIANNPGEVAEAFASAEEYQDKILVQQGRIIELRKNLGFIDNEETSDIQ